MIRRWITIEDEEINVLGVWFRFDGRLLEDSLDGDGGRAYGDTDFDNEHFWLPGDDGEFVEVPAALLDSKISQSAFTWRYYIRAAVYEKVAMRPWASERIKK